MNKLEYLNRVPISKNNICIYRDEKKCNNCGACKGICKSRIGVYDHYDMKASKEPFCINCGQCSLVCPNNSILEVNDYLKVCNEIKKGKKVIVEIAPATRFLLGDEFGYRQGKNVVNKLITALRKLGVSYVYDVTFGADLTICEEATELINRVKNNNRLPLFTSCCPAWVKYCEYFYPKYLENLSSCKSPILMEGAIIKKYHSDAVVVAIVPCTAKKYEITKTNDVDYALTVREVSKWIKKSNINLKSLESGRFDGFTGSTSGLIFGTSGGVSEAVIRYAYHKLTGNNPPKKLLNFEQIRGLSDIKEANVKIRDINLSIAVVNGTGDVPRLMQLMEEENKHYDIVEVMACDGGCIAGGGGPKTTRINNITKNSRSNSIYKEDRKNKRKSSYQNPQIKKIYKNLLSKPGSDMAISLLHNEKDR